MTNPKAYKNGVTTRFPASNRQLADKPITVRLDEEVDEVVRGLANPSDWLRRVIRDAAQRELMSVPPVATPSHRRGGKPKTPTFTTFRGLDLRAGQKLIINGHPCTMRGWIGEEGNEIDVRFDHKVSFQGKSAAYHARIKAREVERLEKPNQ